MDNDAYYEKNKRESALEMLDNNEEVCEQDPEHSKKLIERNFPNKKLQGRILEPGGG